MVASNAKLQIHAAIIVPTVLPVPTVSPASTSSPVTECPLSTCASSLFCYKSCCLSDLKPQSFASDVALVVRTVCCGLADGSVCVAAPGTVSEVFVIFKAVCVFQCVIYVKLHMCSPRYFDVLKTD